jgi:hypothetical protein
VVAPILDAANLRCSKAAHNLKSCSFRFDTERVQHTASSTISPTTSCGIQWESPPLRYGADMNKTGPSLAGLFGRKAGTVEDFNYSDANKNSGIVWDEASLRKILTEPAGPRTENKNGVHGLKDPQQVEDVIVGRPFFLLRVRALALKLSPQKKAIVLTSSSLKAMVESLLRPLTITSQIHSGTRSFVVDQNIPRQRWHFPLAACGPPGRPPPQDGLQGSRQDQKMVKDESHGMNTLVAVF